ncbi:MAG: GH92 family glycosyl hydrolase [Bacteroidales bacterium]|nr:GH92 family glycosyl hydrolase [Bacteroidales bacterium]
MRKLTTFLIAALCLTGCQHTLTSYVNPFVGTDAHGHTFPGAILPFGMVQVSPDTRLDGWDGCSAYHYSDDTVYGFSHTHLSGTGCSDYGDLLLMPFTEENGNLPDSLDYSFYKSSFSHRNEKAEPGYYRVVLDRNRVMAELTVHDRNALHRYTFPNAGRKGVVIDLKHRDVVINSRIGIYDDSDETLIAGHRISAAWNPEQHFYFAIKADCPIEEFAIYKDGHRVDSSKPASGEDLKAIVFFPDNVKEATLTVSISSVNKNGAYKNLAQSDGITFQQAKKEAHTMWEKALGQIEVEGGSREDRANFYTALYHCMTSPYLYSDADGRYLAMKDRDTNIYTIQQAEGRNQYTVFSVWDTYRALHPLLNIFEPERSRDFVLTMLDHYRHSGELTMWELASHETHCMIGYHAVSVILDAYRTGVLDSLDQNTLNELLDAMVATSNLPILGRTEYARDGFLSSEYENESVSKTLEYAYDDWCIAEYARLIGNDSICRIYTRRCQSWKNIMDPDGFMHARRNGAFVTPFDPTEVNNHFTEANSWQYSTYVPHDVEGWIRQIGDAERAERFLDSLFRGSS